MQIQNPALGTPVSGVLTNCTGTAAGLTAGNVTTNATLTGDVTSSGNATTLATVNTNVGSFGSTTAIPNFTVSGKGLITAAGTNVVVAPAGTLTGTTLAAGVTASSLTSVGTLTSLIVTGNVTVDTNTLFVDSTNNRVGILTTSPLQPLSVLGNIQTGTYLNSVGSTFIGYTGTASNYTTNTGESGIEIETSAIGQQLHFRTHRTSVSSGRRVTIDNVGNLSCVGTVTGTSFAGSTAASTITGTTLASNVVTSSLTAFGTSPTFVTPLLGTPTSGVLTNCTGTASGLTAGNVTTNANLTGGVTSVGNAATVVTNANLTGGVTSVGNAATVVTNANLTGDVTSSGNATTLATVNANVGSFGSTTSIPTFTVNGKGLITAASGNVVIAPAGTLTGTTLNSTVVTSSLTSVGTLASLIVTGTSTTTGGIILDATAANIGCGIYSGGAAGARMNIGVFNAAPFTTLLGGVGVENTTLGGSFSQRVNFSTHHYASSNGIRMTLDERGNMLLGTTLTPTGTSGRVIMLGDNAGNPTPATNTAGFFCKDVAGTVEAFAVDEAANVTQLSPHDPLTGEWYYSSENIRTGRKIEARLEKMLQHYDALHGTNFLTESKPLKHIN